MHLRTLRLVAGLVYLRLVRLATAAGSKFACSCLRLSTLMRDGAMEVASHVAGCMGGWLAREPDRPGWLAGWLDSG